MKKEVNGKLVYGTCMTPWRLAMIMIGRGGSNQVVEDEGLIVVPHRADQQPNQLVRPVWHT